jgi:hypothetical protein
MKDNLNLLLFSTFFLAFAAISIFFYYKEMDVVLFCANIVTAALVYGYLGPISNAKLTIIVLMGWVMQSLALLAIVNVIRFLRSK